MARSNSSTEHTGSRDLLAKSIAGEITLAENPALSIKKWREIFGIRQNELAGILRISASVLSDYESGRRKSPGTAFIKRIVEALISYDIKKNNGIIIRKFSIPKSDAVLDIREFLTPVSALDIINAVNGSIVANRGMLRNMKIWGYTVIDSIKAILEFSEKDFIKLYGLTSKRAMIFTKVHLGRSPMIAIKVTQPKPNMVIVHGPKNIDKLAIKIANIEKIPLVISNLSSEENLINNLRKLGD
jgi:putative transcriptional regulator